MTKAASQSYHYSICREHAHCHFFQ